MPKLNIIEGPDRVGKTTYAKTLKGKYHHFEKPVDPNDFSMFLLPLEGDLVLDRSWLSRIYYSWLRDKIQFETPLEKIYHVENYYLMEGYKICYNIKYEPWDRKIHYRHIKEKMTGKGLSLKQRKIEHLNWLPFIMIIYPFLGGDIIYGRETNDRAIEAMATTYVQDRERNNSRLFWDWTKWSEVCKGNK